MRSALSGQDGIALLMVLVVITVLTTLVVSFTDTTQKHLQVTQYYKNRLNAYWAAQSGLQAAVALLRMNFQMTQGQSFDGATSPWHYESDEYQQFVPLLLASVFCESSRLEPALLVSDAGAVTTESGMGRAPTAAPILDENRKLSLYGLVEGSGTRQEQTDPKTFDRLMHLLQYLLKEKDLVPEDEEQGTGLSFGLEEETRIDLDTAERLAGYLVDWMDTENTTTTDMIYNSDSAEQSCPEDGLPYEAKNGPLDSIDEIALACGFRQLPRTTIERLTRHLTAYELATNINTATLPVLHAFCAPPPGDGENEEDSRKIYELLHYDAEDDVVQVIKDANDYRGILGLEVSNTSLIDELRSSTAFASDHFRIGIYGLVEDPTNLTVLARSRIQMDLERQTGGTEFNVLYYRED
jgi:type II secretory pathway component PulK